MQAIGALSLAVWAIPVLAVLWLIMRKVLQAPFRQWIPILFFAVLFATIYMIGTALGPEEMFAILFLLAGGGRS